MEKLLFRKRSLINSENLNGLDFKKSVNAIIDKLQQKKLGSSKTTLRLKDWGISRQRYWAHLFQ